MSLSTAARVVVSGPTLTIAASAVSAVALADALWRDFGRTPPWDEDAGSAWALAAVAAVHAVAYVVLAAGLHPLARTAAGRSRGSTWAARVLIASLTALAGVFFAWTAVARPLPGLELVAGPAFLLLFGSGLALGAGLVRRRTHTHAGLLLLAPLALVPALVGLSALGWDGAHPAYLEVPLYLGCALLARRLQPAAGALDPAQERLIAGRP